MTVTTNPAWLTPPEIAKELRVRESKVGSWIKSGQLTAVDVSERPGGRPRWRIRRDDLDDFLRRRQSQPPPPKPIRRRRRPEGIIQFF
jgi:excisionase family DNA binding protein